MKTLGWPPTYVARCPVTLFEAARGVTSWQTGGTVGELHMRPLGRAAIHFQLNDLLDGQVLFEHTMRKPDAFIVPVDRFFVIRQENGSFRGFGFSNKAAAQEMKQRIEKAVKPYTIGCAASLDTTTKNQERVSLESAARTSSASGRKKPEVLKCESVPKRSSRRTKSVNRASDQSISQQPPVETTMFTRPSAKSHMAGKLRRLVKGLKYLSQLFVFKEHEMEIGYPTDVKHVAHIGWDGPSVNGPSWVYWAPLGFHQTLLLSSQLLQKLIRWLGSLRVLILNLNQKLLYTSRITEAIGIILESSLCESSLPAACE